MDFREEEFTNCQIGLINDLQEVLETLRLDLCNQIYKDLETEHEWRTADEQLIEDASANDWLFNEDGEMEYE